MVITTKLGIDLQRPLYPSVINAVQGDQNTRELEISLYSGGVAFELPEGTTAAMRYGKPDNTKGIYDTMPDGSSAFSISGNTVSILLAPQMLTVPGTVSAQVVLMQGANVLSTFGIQVHVEEDPSAGVMVSEDYTNWLLLIEAELDAYLEKLKVNGEFVGGTVVGAVNMNNQRLYGLREPAAPTDAATKQFVEDTVKNVGGSGTVKSVAGVSPDASGNVALTASDVKALPIGGGTMGGSINMNGQKLSGLNAPTADDEAATKGYTETFVRNAVKEAAPYDYVHNSDFTQFIAQAGIGEKHEPNGLPYAGDRWILDSGTVTGDAREDGNGYTNIKLNGTIRQIVANPPDVGTAFVEMVSGTATIAYVNGEITITSNGGVIRNVMLLKGVYTDANKPAYQPKDYGAELAECMRCFQILDNIKLIGVLFTPNGDTRLNIPFLVPMRTVPTVLINETVSVLAVGANGTYVNFEIQISSLDVRSDRICNMQISNHANLQHLGEIVTIGSTTVTIVASSDL